MANTNALKEVSEYAVIKASEMLGTALERKKISIGAFKQKTFDGVSADKQIVVKVINHSGFTSGNNIPTAKIRSTFADCYFLSLTGAKRKYLIMTNEDFYRIFMDESTGLLEVNDIKLIYIELPENYRSIATEVSKQASDEMTKL